MLDIDLQSWLYFLTGHPVYPERPDPGTREKLKGTFMQII